MNSFRAWLTIASAGWLALAACGGQAAAPASPAKPATSPAASNAAPADWDATVAAAKKEGKVSIIVPVGDDAVRNVLVDPFQKQYGITVDAISLPGAAATARILQERGAGQFNLDVQIAGSAGSLDSLIPSKALDPVEPNLILPEVKDPKNWRGGKLPLLGPAGEILVMTPYQRGTVYYNKNMVKVDELKSYKDLLAAKWKDKLQSDDPRRPGPGQATFIFFYLHPDLGPDFIKALGKQNLTLLNDYQQEVDAVGQGRAPIMMGAADRVIEARIKQGAPIGIVESGQIKEGTDISAASGNASIFNKPPHPNAAKVYLNWLLTKDTQEAYAKTNLLPSARADVNGDWVPQWRYPQPGAINSDGEVAVQIRDKLAPLLKESLGPA
jgi:iron(III) transport system substrate-binding protein